MGTVFEPPDRTMLAPSLASRRSPTMMEKVCCALSEGTPLSVTRTVTGFVVMAKAREGVQVKTPDAGSIRAPRGAPDARLKKNCCAGISGSFAEVATLRV